MDPVSLALLVGVGVTVVVAVTHLTGGSQLARLGTDEDVLAAWRVDHPDDVVTTVQRADDDRTALVMVSESSPGLVFGLGDRLVCRRLAPALLHRVIEGERHLDLRLSDFGARRVRVRLADPALRAAWRRRLEG